MEKMKRKLLAVCTVLLLLVASVTGLFACNKGREADDSDGITIRFVTGYEEKGVIVAPVYATADFPARLPADPVYLGSGLLFAGWYYDEARTDEFDPDRALTEDVVLYARWRDNGSASGGKKDEETEVTDGKGVRYRKLSDEAYAAVGYDGDGKTVEIPATVKGVKVTAVGADFLAGAEEVIAVNIPSTVTEIGVGAFSGGKKLQNIYVNAQNTKYSDMNGALFSSNGTTLVAVGRGRDAYALPAKCAEIEKYAFAECAFNVTFHKNGALHNIGEYAFASYRGAITLDEKITYVRYRAFYGATCAIAFAENCGLQKLGMGEFDGYQGEKLVLPATIGSISGAPFAGCTAEIDFTLTGVRDLGESAFAWYKGEKLDLPYFVESAKNNCFYKCTSEITFDERSAYDTVEEYAFNQFEGVVTFPATVTTVEAYAFYAMKHGTVRFTAAKSAMRVDAHAFDAAYVANVSYGG